VWRGIKQGVLVHEQADGACPENYNGRPTGVSDSVFSRRQLSNLRMRLDGPK